MFNFLRKKSVLLVKVLLNDNEICRIYETDLPCEKRVSVPIPSVQSKLVFQDRSGRSFVHSLMDEDGWLHLSTRVHVNLACQIDCVFSKTEKFDEDDFAQGKMNGIRFQPFFISGGLWCINREAGTIRLSVLNS